LRKDAKIALVVILLLMVIVVIIWGKSPRPGAEVDPYLEREPATVTADDPTKTTTLTDAHAPPAPTDDTFVDVETARRIAPTNPPTDLDPSPYAPGMMNQRPEVAEVTHKGDPPPERRTADDGLPPTHTPRPEPEPKPEPKPKYLATHIIVKGDSYTKLAEKYYGSGKKWRRIYEANKIPPQALTIGRAIKIPHPPAPPKAPAPTAADIARKLAAKSPGGTLDEPKAPERTKAGAKLYTVKKGDSFYSIARSVYRDPTKWQRLYRYNSARLPRPNDPSSLRVGTVIALPDLASAR
jgi:nucleoid-associated protein YgaU